MKASIDRCKQALQSFDSANFNTNQGKFAIAEYGLDRDDASDLPTLALIGDELADRYAENVGRALWSLTEKTKVFNLKLVMSLARSKAITKLKKNQHIQEMETYLNYLDSETWAPKVICLKTRSYAKFMVEFLSGLIAQLQAGTLKPSFIFQKLMRSKIRANLMTELEDMLMTLNLRIHDFDENFGPDVEAKYAAVRDGKRYQYYLAEEKKANEIAVPLNALLKNSAPEKRIKGQFEAGEACQIKVIIQALKAGTARLEQANLPDRQWFYMPNLCRWHAIFEENNVYQEQADRIEARIKLGAETISTQFYRCHFKRDIFKFYQNHLIAAEVMLAALDIRCDKLAGESVAPAAVPKAKAVVQIAAREQREQEEVKTIAEAAPTSAVKNVDECQPEELRHLSWVLRHPELTSSITGLLIALSVMIIALAASSMPLVIAGLSVGSGILSGAACFFTLRAIAHKDEASKLGIANSA